MMMTSVDRKPLWVAVALAAAIAVMYAGVWHSLVAQWSTDDNYSHGFFVVPLALYFAWERREAFARAPVSGGYAGLVLLGGSLLVWMAGTLGSELFLTRVSMIGVIWGAIWFVWSARHARIMAFPVLFLLLMIPLPAIVFNQLAFPLQLLASNVGESAIAAAGVPVLREGNVLHLPARTLEVVEACSGIRSLVSLVMLAIVLGYFTEPRIPARVALALAAVPIAILANAARVAGTGLAAEWIGPAAAEGFFHTFSGWLMFVLAFGGLVLAQYGLSRIRPLRARPALVEAA